MNPIFAYDAPPDSAHTDVLSWTQSEPKATYWALVDVAVLGASTFKAAARRHQWSVINALANTPLEAFGEVAPHLIAINQGRDQRQEQIKQLLKLTTGTPALSWLRSAYPERALQMLFGYLAKAQVQGRQNPVHIRFADVRILPGLLQALHPSQQRRLIDIVQSWRWFDRGGQWQAWPIEYESSDVAEIDSETYLHLAKSQFDRLLKNTEADGVFQKLTHQCPELIPKQERVYFHQNIEKFLATADDLHLITEDDRSLFVFLSLHYGDGFHRCEVLTSTWHAPRDQSGGLQQIVDTWDEPTLSELNNFKATE